MAWVGDSIRMWVQVGVDLQGRGIEESVAVDRRSKVSVRYVRGIKYMYVGIGYEIR